MLSEQREERIGELEELNRSLSARIADLEERLGRNPRNSSMPPSVEAFSKPPVPNRAERRAAKRRPGKQPGSEGKYLAQVAVPDAVGSTHAPVAVAVAPDLSEADVVGVERRQVFELPPRSGPSSPTPHGASPLCLWLRDQGRPALKARAPACYGPGIRALAVYLSLYQHLPYDRLAQLFADVLGIPVSVGALTSMVAQAGGALGPFIEVIRAAVRCPRGPLRRDRSPRRRGLHWVHVASSTFYTLFCCHKRRGAIAMDALGVIAKMPGIAVHDGWKSYRTYDVLHALCNAHHLRELEAVAVGWDQGWADQMIGLLVGAKEAVDAARATGADHLDATRSTRSGPLRHLDQSGLGRQPRADRGQAARYEKKAFNLLTRPIPSGPTCCASPLDFAVSWDNNQAERDVRMVKLQQKISGTCAPSTRPQLLRYPQIFLSTMKKHAQPVLTD